MGEQITAPAVIARFGVFELDTATGELRKNGAKVKLEGQPLEVLTILLERPGQVVTREELRARLWPADTYVDFENSINAAVRRLRQALDDSAETPRYVETLPRRGYRFIYPLTPAPAHPWNGEEPRKQRTRWRWFVGALALAIVAGIALSSSVLRNRIFPAPNPHVSSVAVLPLANLTGDAGQDFLVDGLHDELLTRLAQVSALKVVSRTSVMRYKGQSRPLTEIARELNVDAILEGSVRRENGHFHVTAQLIHGATDRHLWAGSYDRETRDLPALPATIVLAMAKELPVPISGRERARLGAASPADPAVYEAVLKGRYFAAKWTEEGLQKGLEEFRKAIDRDPAYAPAWEGFGGCYELLGSFGYMAPRDAYPKARAAVERALRLDDNLPRAHQTLARVKMMYDWDAAGASREFDRVRKLNPNWEGPTALLAYTGRFDEAIAVGKKAVEIDPLSPSASLVLGWVYFQAGHYDHAIAQLQKTLELEPDYAPAHAQLAWSYAMQHRQAEAVAECNRAIEIVKGRGQAPVHLGCGWVFALAGKRAEALQFAEELQQLRSRRWVDPAELARIYAWLGDNDTAMRYLRQAFDERSPGMLRLKFGRGFPESLRNDARFAALEKQVRFP